MSYQDENSRYALGRSIRESDTLSDSLRTSLAARTDIDGVNATCGSFERLVHDLARLGSAEVYVKLQVFLF